MTDPKNPGTPAKPARADVSAFLEQMKKLPQRVAPGATGRLLFALDATMSRQPTWDQACQIQSEMFEAAASAGGLLIQLVSFRGMGEFDAQPWTTDGATLARRMGALKCRGGLTQIEKVLRHAVREAAAKPVQAMVYVGDAIEENADQVCAAAGELGLRGVPAFMFHEGADGPASIAFREIARLTNGVYCRFDAGSARQLGELLRAVAVYAAGGRKALQSYAGTKGGGALLIAQSLKGR